MSLMFASVSGCLSVKWGGAGCARLVSEIVSCSQPLPLLTSEAKKGKGWLHETMSERQFGVRLGMFFNQMSLSV